MSDYQKVFAIVPLAKLPDVQAAFDGLSESGSAGPVFEFCTLNATGLLSDSPTHYAACCHIGPVGRAALPSLKASIAGSDYLGPFAVISVSEVVAWLLGKGLVLRTGVA
jgi:hypothetical protein